MIHYFNPGHEIAVNNASPYYMAPANIAVMKKDLAFLPAWYADSEDVVLVEDRLGEGFYDRLSEALSFGVKPIVKEELNNYSTEEIALWGISPQGVFLFEELNRLHSLRLQIPQWNDEYTYLNSRQAAKDMLSELIANIPLLSDRLLPQFFSDLERVELEVNRSECQLLAKAPYSSSGRGLLWLPIGGLTRTERQIIHGILKKQGAVSIERVLDRQVDFAMEFRCDGQGSVMFVGYSLFETNSKGAYLGNILRPQLDIEEYLTEMIDKSLLTEIQRVLQDILSEKMPFYKGYLGVDMMVYKENDAYMLQPCVELNLRSNMGVLAINIQQKYLSAKSSGKFFLDFSAKDGDIYLKHKEMEGLYPLQISDNKIDKGYMSLCPVLPDTHYRAYIIVD